MYVRILFLLILFCAAVNLLPADELPLNKKKISYGFVLINSNSFPDYVFIAYPVNVSSGAPLIRYNVLEQDSILEIPCKFGSPSVYAIRKTDFKSSEIYGDDVKDQYERHRLMKEYFESNKNLINCGNINCSPLVDSHSKSSARVDRFNVKSPLHDTLVIELEKTIYYDKDNNAIDEKDHGSLEGRLPAKNTLSIRDDVVDVKQQTVNYLVYVIPALALVGIITIVVLRRKKK